MTRADAGGSENTVLATSHIFNNFSTVVLKGKRLQVSQGFRQKLRKICLVLTQDSAADEVLAAELSRKPLVPSMRPLTPFVKACPVCKAHGARRIITRPWAADDVLKDIVSGFAFGRSSPAQLVQRSPDLRHEWSQILKKLHPDVKRHCQNLRASKHRFESMQKPLGRTVRHFVACHILMLKIACTRTGEPQTRAKQWLSWLAASPCRPLLCALLADASDEAMGLIRAADCEDYNVADIGIHVQVFMARILSLFGPERKALESGYTHLMMTYLSREPLFLGHGWQSLFSRQAQ